MIIEEIKNSIRDALYKEDENIIFHFEEMKHTGFPYAVLSVENFYEEATSIFNRKKCDFSLKLVYMKSQENTKLELLEAQRMISEALLPVIKIKNKCITPDEVNFTFSDKKLVMSFCLSFYTSEIEEYEMMQNIDITIKEN